MASTKKKLIHFKEKQDFESEVANNNIPESSIAFIQDSKQISTHDTYYTMVAWSILESDFIESSQAVAGDVCLYDSVTGKLVICPKDLLREQNIQRFEPIGIVVIPGSHDVYGNGHCGVMSIKAMNCSYPSEGAFENQAMYGGSKADSTAQNYNTVVVYENGKLVGKGFGYISKDGAYNSTTYRIPDPYNPDDSRNPDYYDTKSVPRNGMSDFAGKNNTALFVKMRGVKDYSTWHPSPKTAADYPASSCCDMFYTPGTSQGDWYLPAMGEIGYLMPKWSEILGTISMINELYGNIASIIVDGDCYWSSTEYSGVNMRYVHTSNGAGHSDKSTAAYYVRAFINL